MLVNHWTHARIAMKRYRRSGKIKRKTLEIKRYLDVFWIVDFIFIKRSESKGGHFEA